MEHDTFIAARSYVPRSSAAFQLDDNGRVLGVVANSATQRPGNLIQPGENLAGKRRKIGVEAIEMGVRWCKVAR